MLQSFGKQLHGRLIRRLEHNIKTDLGEVFSERDRWLEVAKMVASVGLRN
jgi:hypothetical protein